MIDLSVEALATVGGVAVFVGLLTQLLVKPALSKFEGEKWYKLVLNAISLVLGIGGAVLAAAAIGPLEYASVLSAVLVGISGTGVAVLGYEGAKNLASALSSG